MIRQVPSTKPYAKAKKVAYQQGFNSERALELEAAGYRAIQGLLKIRTTAALTKRPSSFDCHVCKLTHLQVDDEMASYLKLLACTAKVSGMTDRYLINLFRKMSGHALG